MDTKALEKTLESRTGSLLVDGLLSKRYDREDADFFTRGINRARSIDVLMALSFVPKLRFNDGTDVMYSVREPTPPRACPMDRYEMATHVKVLWTSLTAKLCEKPDKRIFRMLKWGPTLKQVEQWWEACWAHGIIPASWVLWVLDSWMVKQHKRIPIVQVALSDKRVKDPRVRSLYYRENKPIRAKVRYDETGMGYVQRYYAVQRLLITLIDKRRGFVEDHDVKRIVAAVFKGPFEDWKAVQMSVHTTCRDETTRLATAAAGGEFVWAVE